MLSIFKPPLPWPIGCDRMCVSPPHLSPYCIQDACDPARRRGRSPLSPSSVPRGLGYGTRLAVAPSLGQDHSLNVLIEKFTAIAEGLNINPAATGRLSKLVGLVKGVGRDGVILTMVHGLLQLRRQQLETLRNLVDVNI
jgi:hypothetical protein